MRTYRKEHFILLVLPRDLTCRVSQGNSHAVLWVLDSPDNQYSVTELGLQRTARSEYYRRDTVTTTGQPSGQISYQPPNIGAVYSGGAVSLGAPATYRSGHLKLAVASKKTAMPRVLLGGLAVRCLNPPQSRFLLSKAPMA